MDVNAQYNVAPPDGLVARVAGFQRRRMFARFLAECGVGPADTIVDVGATSDRSYESSNYVEAWYPHKDKLTAVGTDDASFLEQLYPGVRFRRADGRALPFGDACFDFAHSSAVIEHVGSWENQVKLLAELWRVCRKGLFVTTPNRWFPVEFHTGLPVLHWLPARAFRAVLRMIGQQTLAREENLNLLSRRELLTAAREAGMRGAQVYKAYLAGWPSNLLLVAIKDPRDFARTSA